MFSSTISRNLQFILEQSGVTGKPVVAIGGFHNGGLRYVMLAKKAGYKIMAVSDKSSALIDLGGNGGLNISELIDLRKKGKDFSTLNLDKVRKTRPEFLLKMEVDILIPEIFKGVINENNASDIRAKVVIAPEKGLITKTAAKILEEKLIPVIFLH